LIEHAAEGSADCLAHRLTWRFTPAKTLPTQERT
jgi:hypothetical protein